MQDKEFLNLTEAASFLGLCLNTVRGLVAAGDIPAKKIGRRYIVSKDALRDWLKK